MIRVGVRQNDVFDLPAIQANLPHAAEDFILRCIVEQCLEDNDSLIADDCPCVVNPGSQEIEVVGNFSRLSIPGFLGRRSRRSSTRAAACCCRVGRSRRNTESEERARPLETSRILCCRNKAVYRSWRRLRRYDTNAGCKECGGADNECKCLHAVSS